MLRGARQGGWVAAVAAGIFGLTLLRAQPQGPAPEDLPEPSQLVEEWVIGAKPLTKKPLDLRRTAPQSNSIGLIDSSVGRVQPTQTTPIPTPYPRPVEPREDPTKIRYQDSRDINNEISAQSTGIERPPQISADPEIVPHPNNFSMVLDYKWATHPPAWQARKASWPMVVTHRFYPPPAAQPIRDDFVVLASHTETKPAPILHDSFTGPDVRVISSSAPVPLTAPMSTPIPEPLMLPSLKFDPIGYEPGRAKATPPVYLPEPPSIREESQDRPQGVNRVNEEYPTPLGPPQSINRIPRPPQLFSSPAEEPFPAPLIESPVPAVPVSNSAVPVVPIRNQEVSQLPEIPPDIPDPPNGFLPTPRDAPLGFTGPSGVLPRDVQTSDQAVPIEDRWRIGFPRWDRYGKGHPTLDDYPYVEGYWWNPYTQNVLKGDYPILGQNTFLAVTASSRTIAEYHEVPIPTTPFESTERIRTQQFFGRPNQFLGNQFFLLSLDLFHGDAAFKPFDWRAKITPIFNMNYLAGEEVGIVNPNVRRGLDRGRSFVALEEWFLESKLSDLGPNYDFLSVRVGSQPFNSDFRGLIFSDINRAVRIFGNRNSNREQFNLAFFAQAEKDTNSGLNSFNDREQRLVIGNYYIQDFLFPGYTAQFSVHYNHDDPSFKFDTNSFLVRPDPVGTFQRHGLDVFYLGWTGDGHINRFNINHAAYWATGRDSQNPIANQGVDISAFLGACELSYDRDWARFRTSVFYATGDDDPLDSHGGGFDGILDNPNFAGGEFSYWQRQSIRLFGVNLTNRESLFPNLRSSKIQGQSNFVNPGLFLYNVGADFEITPRLRLITNANLLWFDTTEVLKVFVYQNEINKFIGTDLSAGVEYRPYLNNNVIFNFGLASLIPGQGFSDLYDNIRSPRDALFAAFVDMILTY